MKVVIAAEIFPPDIGGPATYGKFLAEQLAGIGWPVSVVCYGDLKPAKDQVFNISRQQNVFKRYWRYFRRLKKMAGRADLLYAMGPVGSGLPAILVKKLAGKKVVVKVTGDYAWEQARNLKKTDLGIDEFQNKKFGGKIGLLKRLEIWVCQNADLVVVPSQYLKKIVVGWGIKADKISVIYNAETLAANAASKNPSNLIISIGRLVPWKGFETLINLLPELLAVDPNLRLEICGDGPEKEKLEKLIVDLNLGDRINLAGCDHNQLMSKLTNAELFVLNTGYEGLSHTILEAMAAGTPVITTNIGGNPELINNGENGLLVEYNNQEQLKEAILKLHADSNLRQKFIVNSRAVLEKFTFESMLNQTVRTLEIINNK